ncbi:MAG: type II toxin-antitoxin system PemK/MazF family toxin [Gallionella sp.]|nr:type II toxin-antitoxin system PemK/MazF family toxin [Gallionella sp.]
MKRGEAYWVNLDPTVGSEVNKRRPAVILSPDEMNRRLPVVIVAPITSSKKPWPTRTDITLSGKAGQIMLDEIRTVDKSRLMKRIAEVDIVEALDALQIMFAP